MTNLFKNILLVLLIACIIYFLTFQFYSIKLSPITSDEPSYEPEKWNSNLNIKNSHNCYTYALNDINKNNIDFCNTNNKKRCVILKPQPGHYTGNYDNSNMTCNSLKKRTKMDNPSLYDIDFNRKCKDNYYKIALFTDPYNMYHFYRQDNNGYWSHKDGSRKATNIDKDGNLISDPRTANKTSYNNKYNYNDFCGFMCVPSNNHKKTNTANIFNRNSIRIKN